MDKKCTTGENESFVLNNDLMTVWTSTVIYQVTTLLVVMLFTLVGNITLIIVLTCHTSLRRKRVSVFLINLAVADLLVCVITMTSEIFFDAFGEWVLGAVACKVAVYSQIVTLASTTFLLTAMSMDRFQILVQPLRSISGPPSISRKVIVSWLLAFTFAIPQLFIFVETHEVSAAKGGRIISVCKSLGYTAPWQRKVYFTFLTAYILIIPTVVMFYCYANIIRVVWQRTKTCDGERWSIPFLTSRRNCTSEQGDCVRGNHLSIPNGLTASSKKKVIQMTLSVIVAFVVCWTPYFIVNLIRIYSDYNIKLATAKTVSEIMALGHSALNPFLYMAFSRRAVQTLSCCSLCACSDMRRMSSSILLSSNSRQGVPNSERSNQSSTVYQHQQRWATSRQITRRFTAMDMQLV